MTKRSFIFLLLMVLTWTGFVYSQTAGLTTVYINGQQVTAKAVEQDSVVYLPLHVISRYAGVNIKWNAKTKSLTVGSSSIKTGSFIYEGIVYVPLEAVVTLLSGEIEWDNKNKAVRVTLKTNGTTLTASPMPLTLTSMPSPTASIEITPSETPSPAPTPEVTPTPTPKPTPSTLVGGIFIPRSAENEYYRITVSDLKITHLLKEYYQPKPYHKFVVVYINQSNISGEVQIYTGKFSLMDTKGRGYDYIVDLSNYWYIVLLPGGANFGYLVFQVEEDVIPDKVVLHVRGLKPLYVDLL